MANIIFGGLKKVGVRENGDAINVFRAPQFIKDKHQLNFAEARIFPAEPDCSIMLCGVLAEDLEDYELKYQTEFGKDSPRLTWEEPLVGVELIYKEYKGYGDNATPKKPTDMSLKLYELLQHMPPDRAFSLFVNFGASIDHLTAIQTGKLKGKDVSVDRLEVYKETSFLLSDPFDPDLTKEWSLEAATAKKGKTYATPAETLAKRCDALIGLSKDSARLIELGTALRTIKDSAEGDLILSILNGYLG